MHLKDVSQYNIKFVCFHEWYHYNRKDTLLHYHFPYVLAPLKKNNDCSESSTHTLRITFTVPTSSTPNKTIRAHLQNIWIQDNLYKQTNRPVKLIPAPVTD